MNLWVAFSLSAPIWFILRLTQQLSGEYEFKVENGLLYFRKLDNEIK